AAAPAPYGTNDAGGFRNVLPPGQVGTDNVFQLAQFQATGQRPPHWDDQIPLYDGLVYASPGLTAADVEKYFKDATFGVMPDDVDRTYSPPGRPGVTIVRDKQYGVPRIYGDTDEDVVFGAGYAGAEDRLFFMDILRHTGRAQLSSFAGGSASNRAMDRTQWGIAPYTEADLQRQIDANSRLYGEAGERAVRLLDAYVAGINAYVNEARTNPNKMPGEYAAFGKSPEPWKPTDVIAESSLVGGIFGKGGGQELRSAIFFRELEARFGTARARRIWADFRSKDDPEHLNTVPGRRFPYATQSAFSKRGLALPDPGSVKFEPIGPPPENEGRGRDPASLPHLPVGTAPPHASNWLLVPARSSASGRPIAVMGPQVGYFVPQVLVEQELHGPSFDARGTAFPGVNLMTQLGHGRDYAWSATTATADNVDTFAEVLCEDDFHYLYRGRCLAMEKLERTNSWTPNAADDTPPGSETLTAYRTVHGIVYARGTVKGKKVAFASARTTYFHEADSALGFFRLNDPSFVKDPQSFRRAVDGINFAFNWSYVDSKHIAYQLSGAYPRRAKGTSPDFPILGTGEYDWKGFDPVGYTMRTVPLDERPHAVDQKYLISWNNKQAPGWTAADNQYAYGSIARAQMLTRMVEKRLKNGRKMRLHELVRAMSEPATQDLRATHLLPTLLRVLRPKDQQLRDALELLAEWRAAGANRRDLDRDGRYDHDAAVTLMDAWWPRMARDVFRPVLGDKAVAALDELLPIGEQRGGQPAPPDFFGGWWGYLSKDLRTLFKIGKPRGRYSRIYCGKGSRARCRATLEASLREAL
ncbi:MAG TPA: penicillin acylase family protein, partial [Thermoleophilaceae bacterium]|nr:penicillin acylase family protein [Thermoleophilaceae bacterium]